MKIGKIILYHRKKAGLSRIALARLAGVGKTMIYDIEHGKETVSFYSLLQIFKVLNIQCFFRSPFMHELEEESES